MKNGIPISAKKEHGYECLSIQSIVQRHQGKCHFSTNNKIFILRIILPLK